MVELIGDICRPSEMMLPVFTTTEADAISGTALIAGTIIYNTTIGKAEVWTGAVWETITSVGR